MNRQKKLPFVLDRNDARSLVVQLVDGFREAIVGGYYAPGDVLPSYRDLAPLLDVSQIVTKAALRHLSNEGLIVSRPRIGSVVRDCGEKRWLGNVVFVYPESDISYFQTVFAEEVRSRLAAAGYLMTQVRVGSKGDNGYDLSLLDAALARSVDLAVVLYERPQIFRSLNSRKVPFVAVGQGKSAPRGSVGFSRLDYNLAVPDFAAECRAIAAKRVVEFFWDSIMCDATPILRASGVPATKTFLRPDMSRGQLFGVERAGRLAFERLIAQGKVSRDAVYFFADDYLARGALTALANAGLKAPADIRIATWANAGLGPDYLRELSRMEMDPVHAGATVAKAVLSYLKNGTYPDGIVIGPKWVAGETLNR
ncbi:MAG: GntR family transcriptional regulator [Kiritimatiellae bacterium]|nr:GntR family transcriptional regulator [Kiritimatiellia bacterium]